ncbi:MAG TPA: ATP-binding protein [Candidatus Acidoferrales bacterium]|nr:ATP-binding protein [Candidatus Acidoferrales bacterium]
MRRWWDGRGAVHADVHADFRAGVHSDAHSDVDPEVHAEDRLQVQTELRAAVHVKDPAGDPGEFPGVDPARAEVLAARSEPLGKALRMVLENSAESLILMDRQGTIVEASPNAAALLFPPRPGTEKFVLEELFSGVARDAVVEWRSRLDAPAGGYGPESGREKPSAVAALEAALQRGAIVRLHLRGQIRTEIRGETRGAGSGRPQWLILVEDCGASRAQHETEDRLEAEMAGLLDSIESGVLLLDAQGRILKASDRLAAIFGFESRRLLELGTIGALIDSVAYHLVRPAETAARWREHVRRGDEASWDEFELLRPSRKIVERFARPLHKPDGTRLGWLEVYRDITGQRMIQSKLLQTEKMAALGQIVSGIAHELNNPLTSIQGYAQLLLGRGSTADRAGDAQRISQEAKRAGRIVKNLLLFARETKPERSAVNLNEVIERTLSLRAYELKLQNIDLELVLDPGLPQTLADAAQLQQVVLNLIVNAEQAIVAGRGETIRNGRILIRTRRLAGDRVAMEIMDDGQGIAPENVARIFDPFFTTKPPGVGTGLGLSIAYGIVQEHGGEVSVESLLGRGTTLTVELPALTASGLEFVAAQSAARARTLAVVPRESPERAAAPGANILVVEDEPTVAALIADVLTDAGHQVDTLLDSRAALGQIAEKTYSLVICDLKMPYVDGPELYRALVRQENPMQHRVLFVTGDTMGPRTLEFLKSSGLPYLAKPFLVEELKEAVRQALAGAPSNEQRTAGAGQLRSAAREPWQRGRGNEDEIVVKR